MPRISSKLKIVAANEQKRKHSKHFICKVQSAICVPATGAVVNKSDEMLTIKGYAFSGGGKDVDNVKISVDGGHTWEFAVLNKIEQPYNRYFESNFYLSLFVFYTINMDFLF